MNGYFQWYPDRILGCPSELGPGARKFALVVLNQPLMANVTFNQFWKNAHLRLAADGGANRLYDSFHSMKSPSLDHDAHLTAIIGDLDSLRPSVGEYFASLEPPTRVISVPGQDSWDFEKVLAWLRSEYSDILNVVIIGDIGGRVDHGLRQIHNLHLATPGTDYTAGLAFLVSSKSLSFILKPGRHCIHVGNAASPLVGNHIGILPAGKPSTVTTSGLERDFHELRLWFGGHIITGLISPRTSELNIITTHSVLFTIDILETYN